LERAQLYDVAAVVTDVGGLKDQVAGRADVVIVSTDIELRTAMERNTRARMDETTEPWPSGGDDLRERVQKLVVARASMRRGGPVVTEESGRGPVVSSLSAPLRAVPPIAAPAPVSARWGATTAKRLVARATRWLFDPVLWEINAVREATIRALDEIDRER
jgi:hypothetical protein